MKSSQRCFQSGERNEDIAEYQSKNSVEKQLPTQPSQNCRQNSRQDGLRRRQLVAIDT